MTAFPLKGGTTIRLNDFRRAHEIFCDQHGAPISQLPELPFPLKSLHFQAQRGAKGKAQRGGSPSTLIAVFPFELCSSKGPRPHYRSPPDIHSMIFYDWQISGAI